MRPRPQGDYERLMGRCGLAFGSGLALALAFAPLSWSWLIPPAIAGLLAAVHHLPARVAWLPGLCFGLSFSFVLQWWMLVLGVAPLVGIGLVEAAFYAPLGCALALITRLRWWQLPAAAAVVTTEELRARFPFSGMPWGRLSYAVADTPWASGLPYYGFTGVSLLLALTGAWLCTLLVRLRLGRYADAERPRTRRLMLVVGAVALAVLTVAPVLLPWRVVESGSARIAVVQPDVPGAGDDLVAVHREVTAALAEQTIALAGRVRAGGSARPDFILWPENSTAVDPFADVQAHGEISTAVRDIGVPVLLAAMVDDSDPTRIRNRGLVWQPNGEVTDSYDKRHPVAFGEYLPWRGSVITSMFKDLQKIPRDMVAGDRDTPLQVADLLVADAICFDVAFDDGLHAQLRHGGELITVQTSNATYVYTFQLEQQFEITRLRAVETGRWLAVSSTNGISAIVGPDGRTHGLIGKGEQGTLEGRVGLSDQLTPAVQAGQTPMAVCLLFALGGLVWSWCRYLLTYRGKNVRPSG